MPVSNNEPISNIPNKAAETAKPALEYVLLVDRRFSIAASFGCVWLRMQRADACVVVCCAKVRSDVCDQVLACIFVESVVGGSRFDQRVHMLLHSGGAARVLYPF
jgi:hypothetical protein